MDQSNAEKLYGRCVECKQINTGENWCQTCNSRRLQQNFNNWTSGNNDVDKFIQNIQLSARNKYQLLEWIPYDRFSKVKYVAKGEFGKIYKAIWNHHGLISHWDVCKSQWKKIASYVKIIDDNSLNHFVEFYGVSQDPKTKDYILVMQYARSLQYWIGMREGIYGKPYEFNWHLKLKDGINILSSLANGLERIHEEGLIHRNLHMGNLELKIAKNSIYGVLPYLAPEILREKPYTKESNIYNFGIIMYEVISNIPPYYHEVKHNEHLSLKICEELRPRFNIKVPQLILHLIKRYLDANPLSRLNVRELSKILHDWLNELKKHTKNKTELTKIKLIKQIEESEKINNSSSATNNLSLTNITCSKAFKQ
ncbi:kinase-like domain-containing protein [Rhizophagus clarus]|uniref:Kinase-like domain-containing protein n=1 Tax=Rhizophagus clarus TaxID=94130 RepID=A0A8H3KRA6_9GLOM|nr:kinase-like domain-containing protein [Rhizophagus clarus]